MKEYRLVLNQYVKGELLKQIIITAENEVEAWKKLREKDYEVKVKHIKNNAFAANVGEKD